MKHEINFKIEKSNTISLQWPKKFNHIPNEVFTRSDIYEEELKRIFYGPEWIGIAHTSEIPKKGDFKTVSVGKVPLLITRDIEDNLHVFYNACSHRSNQLVTASSGNKSDFQCPYHRWRFNTKGDLIFCPNRTADEYSPGFSRNNFPLRQPRMAIVHGVIFVTMSSETPPIEIWLEGYTDHLAHIFGGDGRLKLLGYHKMRFKANWKVYRDNDLYHPGLLHTAFRLLDWQGGKGRQFANNRGHWGHTGDISSTPKGADALLKDPSLLKYKGTNSASLRTFPVYSATRHLDVINTRYLNPCGVNETEIHWAYFGRADDDEAFARHRVRQASNVFGTCGLVTMEDAAVFHRIQIGSETPGLAIFQKGVKDEYSLPQGIKGDNSILYEYEQNDESGNLPGWEYYRQIMGFERGLK